MLEQSVACFTFSKVVQHEWLALGYAISSKRVADSIAR